MVVAVGAAFGDGGRAGLRIGSAAVYPDRVAEAPHCRVVAEGRTALGCDCLDEGHQRRGVCPGRGLPLDEREMPRLGDDPPAVAVGLLDLRENLRCPRGHQIGEVQPLDSTVGCNSRLEVVSDQTEPLFGELGGEAELLLATRDFDVLSTACAAVGHDDRRAGYEDHCEHAPRSEVCGADSTCCIRTGLAPTGQARRFVAECLRHGFGLGVHFPSVLVEPRSGKWLRGCDFEAPGPKPLVSAPLNLGSPPVPPG